MTNVSGLIKGARITGRPASDLRSITHLGKTVCMKEPLGLPSSNNSLLASGREQIYFTVIQARLQPLSGSVFLGVLVGKVAFGVI
jgi:hypothetical protein